MSQGSKTLSGIPNIGTVTDGDTGDLIYLVKGGNSRQAHLGGLAGGAIDFARVGIGGATADDTNRLSVNSPAVLFNHAGAGIQVKVNKSDTGETASFLFQTGFSGRAEIGLVGDDDFQFKVSPDGSTFYSAITLDKDDGAATFAGLGGMHPDRDPTVIDRLSDRLFLGGAAEALGTFTDDQGDVIAGSSAEGANWAIRDGQFVAISPHGLIAMTGMSRNSDHPAYHSAPATIGVAGFAINDGDTGTGRAWGLYGDVQHEAGARYSYGIELAVKNKGSNITSQDPYNFGPLGSSFGAWFAGGGDDSYGGAGVAPATAAIIIGANSNRWNKGIVFGANGLTGSDGDTSGSGSTAIALARKQKLEWYYASGGVAFDIMSDVGAGADKQRMLVDVNGVRFQNQNGLSNFFVHNESGSITGRLETVASTSANPTLLAGGSATDINIVLTPKGAGTVVSTDGFLSNDPTKGNGYTTGAGGTVTQLTSKSTGVTLNKVSGKIEMNGAALNAGTPVQFRLTNSAIGPNDTVSVTISSDTGVTTDAYQVVPLDIPAAGGSVGLRVTNVSGSALSQSVKINFNVIKGAAS